MKKVYGLLVVLILFAGCFLVPAASEQKQVELLLVNKNKGETIYDAQYEVINNKVVPKFITTAFETKIYKGGKLLKVIRPKSPLGESNSSWVKFLSTEDGRNFASFVAIEADPRGYVENEEVNVYDSRGNTIWKMDSGKYLFYNPYLFSNENDWVLIDFDSESQRWLTFFHKNSMKDIHFKNEYFTKIQEGFSGVLVLSDECSPFYPDTSKPRNCHLYLLDFDGNIVWKRTVLTNEYRSPKLLVGKDNCCLVYRFENQIVCSFYDAKGNFLATVAEKCTEESGLRVAMNDDYLFFSENNILYRVNIKSKIVDKKTKTNKEILQIFNYKSNVIILYDFSINKKQKIYPISIFTSNFSDEIKATFSLPEENQNIIKKIVVENSFLYITTKDRVLKVAIY